MADKVSRDFQNCLKKNLFSSQLLQILHVFSHKINLKFISYSISRFVGLMNEVRKKYDEFFKRARKVFQRILTNANFFS